MPGMLAIAILLMAGTSELRSAPAGFQKVSPHFFYLTSKSGAANTGAVITTEGVLLIDPPPEPEVPAMLNALKSLTTRPVRWVVNTDYQKAGTGGWATFLKQGAAVIDSKELDRLASAASVPDPDQPAAPAPIRPNPRFLFGQQMRLWPANIEIRILAVKSKARTAGDVVVFLPSEKVLATGDLFSASSFPIIDSGAGEGSARGWIDGLKQVIDFVPLLKSAMPQPKQEIPVPPEPEKTLEELVAVIPGHGEAANLQQMKSLLTAAQKLRTEAHRAVTAGRTRDEFVKSLALDIFGEFGNLEAFAGQLFDDLSRK
jgi:glyoxylase-like metal-dependent hydrolase (beta-lactamase superfamily II)